MCIIPQTWVFPQIRQGASVKTVYLSNEGVSVHSPMAVSQTPAPLQSAGHFNSINNRIAKLQFNMHINL